MEVNYVDLGGAVLKNFGRDKDDIPNEAANWFYESFPIQGLIWVRENAKLCYYFTEKPDGDGFTKQGNKITGFKSRSKYHPINAVIRRGEITTAALPGKKKHCAVFPRSELGTCLEVEARISDENIYTVAVVTVKFDEKVLTTRQQVYTNLNRALTALGNQFTIYGVDNKTNNMQIQPPHGFDDWMTIWIQWGTATDPASHVYIITENGLVDKAFTTNYGSSEKLRIGALPGGGDGFMGSMAAFEVFTSTERFPSSELRRLIIEDHQTLVRKTEKGIKVVE